MTSDDLSVPRTVAPVAIVGPTASGKSSLALHLAAAWAPAGIVCCDSVQVYRGFDIGSAKPTAAQRAACPHRLVDEVDWHQGFDAQTYRERAHAAVAELAKGGRTVLICGGSGLYLRALRLGLRPAPPVDPALRSRLQRAWDADPQGVVATLQARAPEVAAQTDLRNPRRVLRALELCMQGAPTSPAQTPPPPLPMHVFALQLPAAALRARIVARTRAMLAQGLVAEVASLLREGVLPTCKPMQAVGYRQCVALLQKKLPPEALEEAVVQATWQYARRHRTWLRRAAQVVWVDNSSPRAAAAFIAHALRTAAPPG